LLSGGGVELGRIIELLDEEARLLETGSVVRPAEADVVVLAEEPLALVRVGDRGVLQRLFQLAGRNLDERPALGPEHAMELGDRRSVISDVFEDVAADDVVEGAVLERQRRDVRPEIGDVPIAVDREVAQPRQRGEPRAERLARPYVEDVALGLSHPLDVAKVEKHGAVARQRPATRALIVLAVEAGELADVPAADRARNARADVEHRRHTEERTPRRCLVPRRKRRLERGSRKHPFMVQPHGRLRKRLTPDTVLAVADTHFNGLVLCYHNVSDSWSHQLALAPRSFERQLSTLLRRGYRPVPAETVLDGRRRTLHVTFDDAYADLLPNAIPELERLGIPATLFVATAFADEGRPLDVPELAGEARANPDRLRTMSWDELGELQERGFTVGSHTVSHPHLTSLSDGELDWELRESRARVESRLGRPCTLFAYPYGEHDERVRAAVRRAGYEAAFALGPGTPRDDRYAIPRVDLYRRDSLVRATLKTSFVKPYASALLARLPGRSLS
jgi:peptidoglycan/xylan/chitin deacetylase (PgdA/CDA1 family)